MLFPFHLAYQTVIQFDLKCKCSIIFVHPSRLHFSSVKDVDVVKMDSFCIAMC